MNNNASPEARHTFPVWPDGPAGHLTRSAAGSCGRCRTPLRSGTGTHLRRRSSPRRGGCALARTRMRFRGGGASRVRARPASQATVFDILEGERPRLRCSAEQRNNSGEQRNNSGKQREPGCRENHGRHGIRATDHHGPARTSGWRCGSLRWHASLVGGFDGLCAKRADAVRSVMVRDGPWSTMRPAPRCSAEQRNNSGKQREPPVERRSAGMGPGVSRRVVGVRCSGRGISLFRTANSLFRVPC